MQDCFEIHGLIKGVRALTEKLQLKWNQGLSQAAPLRQSRNKI